MDAVEVVSFSMHVKIFDMPDALPFSTAKLFVRIDSAYFTVIAHHHSRKRVQLIRLIRFPCTERHEKNAAFFSSKIIVSFFICAFNNKQTNRKKNANQNCTTFFFGLKRILVCFFFLIFILQLGNVIFIQHHHAIVAMR